MSAQFVRIQPESARTPSAMPGQTLEFVLANAGQLIASTARLEFGLSVGKGSNSWTALEIGDLVRAARYCGAWGFIKQITVTNGRGTVLSDITECGRMMSALYAARYSDSALEMSTRRGGLEMCARATITSVRSLLSTSGVDGTPATSYDGAAANAFGVSLDLSLGGLGIFGATLPLDLIGGIRVSIRLAEVSESLCVGAGSPPDGLGYFFNNATLTASILHTATPPKPAGMLSWTNISTMRNQLDTGRKQMVFNDLAATAATGFVLTFVLSSSLRNLSGDGYDLSMPPAIVEVTYAVAGVAVPLSYTQVVLDPTAIDQDYADLIDVACGVFGGQIAAPGSSLASNALTAAGASIPTFFMLGARFDAPVNLRQNPLSVTVVSSVDSSAPYTAYLHVVSTSSISFSA